MIGYDKPALEFTIACERRVCVSFRFDKKMISDHGAQILQVPLYARVTVLT